MPTNTQTHTTTTITTTTDATGRFHSENNSSTNLEHARKGAAAGDRGRGQIDLFDLNFDLHTSNL
jgi:hypothetical protein